MPDRGVALSLRTRMVLLGTIGVTLILLAGGLLLGAVWRRTLIGNVSQTTALRSRDIAALVKRGTVPDPVPVSGRDEALVQIVGPDGDVLAASANMRQRPALALPRPPPGETKVSQVEFLPVDDDEAGFRVAASTVQTAAGPTTVVVASSLEDVSDTIAAAGRLAFTALPLLLPLWVALWVLVSRTLAPVAAITQEAREISARDLRRRVPQPRRRDEIGLLADTLNRMLGRLEAASTRQRRFVADAAHELRSPIANLRTQLETARASSQRVDWLQTSSELLATTIRMQRLSDQLLLLARLDGAGLVPRRRAVDLDDVVAVTVARVCDCCHDLEIDLSALSPVQLQADPTLVEHAVGNLIDNALRHARGRLRVATASDDHTALVSVEDDGPGIPVDRRDHVVRPFARLDEARDRDAGGAGLGLTIAGDIAAAHGGRLTIGDSDLGGAAVRIELRC